MKFKIQPVGEKYVVQLWRPWWSMSVVSESFIVTDYNGMHDDNYDVKKVKLCNFWPPNEFDTTEEAEEGVRMLLKSIKDKKDEKKRIQDIEDSREAYIVPPFKHESDED